MNPDEDPSFPFLCEGSSGDLEIFGETTGVLQVMSTSSEVNELEDVFVKPTDSIPAPPHPSDAANPAKADMIRNAARNVLSEFGVGNSGMEVDATTSKKVNQSHESALILSSAVELRPEMQGVLMDPNSAVGTESSELISVEQSHKSLQENTATTVPGSVELAEEIMEAFANSKGVLDPDHSVSTDASQLQEELDKLEQLAVERVREIEGDLVTSSHQITESNMTLEVSSAVDDNQEKILVDESVTRSDVIESDKMDISCKNVCGSNSENYQQLTITSLDKVTDISDFKGSREGNAERKLYSEELAGNSETVGDNIMIQKEFSSEPLGSTVSTQPFNEPLKAESESCTKSLKIKNRTDKLAKSEECRRSVEEETPCKDVVDGNVTETQPLTQRNNEIKIDDKIQILYKNDEEKQNLSNINSRNNEPINVQPCCQDKESQSVLEVDSKRKEKFVKDLRDYENEDDDLEVLEAFIEKSATNPELVICTTETKKESSKYSLESSLIDDLTKTDDNSGNGTDNVIELESESCDSKQPQITPQSRLSQALERASLRIESVIGNADVLHGTKESETVYLVEKQKLSPADGKQLPLKKRLSQRSVDDDISVFSSEVANEKITFTKKSLAKSTEIRVLGEKERKRNVRSGGLAKNPVVVQKSCTDPENDCSVQITLDNSQCFSNEENITTPSTTQSHPPVRLSKRHIPTQVKKNDLNASKGRLKANSNENRKGKILPLKESVKIKKVAKMSADKNQASDTSMLETLQSQDKGKEQKNLSGDETAVLAVNVGDSKKRKVLKKDSSSTKASKETLKSLSVQEKVTTKGSDIVKQTTLLPAKRRKKEERKLKVRKCQSPKRGIDNYQNHETNTYSMRSSKRIANAQKVSSIKKSKSNTNKDSENRHTKKLDICKNEEIRPDISDKTNSISLRKSIRVNTLDMKPQINDMRNTRSLKGNGADKSPDSPTKMKHDLCGRENKSLPAANSDNVHISLLTPSQKSINSSLNDMFLEFENITFDDLKNCATQIILPSPLWSAQVCHEKNVVIFSRVGAELCDEKPIIDKALVFQRCLKPTVLIMNEPVDLPILSIRTFEDVFLLIRNFHSLSFCEGTGVKQRPRSKNCFKFLDVANPGHRCTQCLEERRRVLFACARKLRERLRLLRCEKHLE